MSKKNRHKFFSTLTGATPVGTPMSAELAAEYRIIRHDLVRVLVMNLVFLAALLVLFYTNSHSHYLDAWAARLLHF